MLLAGCQPEVRCCPGPGTTAAVVRAEPVDCTGGDCLRRLLCGRHLHYRRRAAASDLGGPPAERAAGASTTSAPAAGRGVVPRHGGGRKLPGGCGLCASAAAPTRWCQFSLDYVLSLTSIICPHCSVLLLGRSNSWRWCKALCLSNCKSPSVQDARHAGRLLTINSAPRILLGLAPKPRLVASPSSSSSLVSHLLADQLELANITQKRLERNRRTFACVHSALISAFSRLRCS